MIPEKYYVTDAQKTSGQFIDKDAMNSEYDISINLIDHMRYPNLPLAIDSFFADRTVQRLLDLSRETRPLQICFPREVPISRFLAWILDPSQGHGLQDAPIRRLLTEAWLNLDDAQIDLPIERYLSPAHLSTKSFAGCVIQKEVRLVEGAGQLDVLILHPKESLVIAIENKFGAGIGADQLQKYSRALAERYPGWKRIQIFIDLYGEAPDDTTWIGLDYDWLVEELSVAEASPWLGEEPRRVIKEFRHCLELDGDAYSHLELDDGEILDVVQEHRVVFEQMQEWMSSKDKLPELVDQVFSSSTTLYEKALQNLFPVFWQRIELWRICVPMLSYVDFYSTVLAKYPLALHDPRRKAFFYCLPDWCQIQDESAEDWAVRVMVRILPPKANSTAERYVVVSSFDLEQVDEVMEEAIRGLAERLRTQHLKKKRKIKEDQGRITLRVDHLSNLGDAQKSLVHHIAILDRAIKEIL